MFTANYSNHPGSYGVEGLPLICIEVTGFIGIYTIPYASIALATLMKPAMLAPAR